jgi:hypothetical protein
MSKQLLYNLNGNKHGQLKAFLDTFQGEPRIAWYPSCGTDFRALLYLHPSFSELHPATQKEPQSPDFFLYTDYYYHWEFSTFLNEPIAYSDDRTSVIVESIEQLPRLNLSLHEEIVQFSEGSSATDHALFLRIRIDSNKLGSITFPVLYAFAENEEFYCRKLIPNNSKLSHIIHVRYGGSGGGGGNASGIWLLNVLEQLQCEMFITDNHHCWQQGDLNALDLCPHIPKDRLAQLESIRTVKSISWSGNGDVTWNLIV